MLMLTLVGFQPYYLRGEGFGGRTIAPDLFLLVLIHGVATTAWMVLFLLQSWLIAAQNRRLHLKLGWSAVAVALTTAVSGVLLAIRSVESAPEFNFWGMPYRQFLLVMLAEMAVYVGFVVAGLAWRRRLGRHRSMLLLATLSLLAGATVRIPALIPLFGDSGWIGIFGPIFALGALGLILRSLINQTVDRSLAVGYVVMVVCYVGAVEAAGTEGWERCASGLLGF
jgi:hypothetical protein